MLTASPRLYFKICFIDLVAFFNIIFVNKLFAKMFFMFEKIYLTYDIQKCLFSVNINIVAPSQFAIHMHITPTCIHRVF